MDLFDKRLFDELKAEYEKDNLSEDELEEIYDSFCSLGYLDEVKPYLFAMRYMGTGVKAEPDQVMEELKCFENTDGILAGLYYDLLLYKNQDDSTIEQKLIDQEKNGYTNIYLKEKSSVKNVSSNAVIDSEKVESQNQQDERLVIEKVRFESNGYNGIYFAAGEIEYLNSIVYIKPIKTNKHIKVKSQIFLNDKEFSKPFYDEYDIGPETTWFRTTGWGNKNYNCYSNNLYKWVVTIENETSYYQQFRVYSGKIDKNGLRTNDIRLFASTAGGAQEKDLENYKVSFDSGQLESVYFKFFIDPPGVNKTVQVFITVTHMETNTKIFDGYYIHCIEHNFSQIWYGVSNNAGKWQKGLYQYSARIGNGNTFEGTFSVY